MSSLPIEAATDHGPVGLLGGTFDPIHFGHLRLAEEAREALGLSQVTLIPAGDPPHRAQPQSDGHTRLALVGHAIADNPRLQVDASEVEASGKSYSVLTLERLRAEYGPARSIVLILGADAFKALHTWHRWDEILQLAHVAVANRPGTAPHGRRWPGVLSAKLDQACAGRIHTDPAVLRHAASGWVVPFDMTPLAISASLIRDLIRAGHSARYLLPDSVLDYIDSNHLYR